MSIRYIGSESSPFPTHKYNTKYNPQNKKTQSHENQRKFMKILQYKQQLDKQVQQNRQRKQKQKFKEMEEDRKRQSEFYKSVEKNKNQNYNHKKMENYHNNPEEAYIYDDFDEMEDENTFAKIGKQRLGFDSPGPQRKLDFLSDKNQINLSFSRQFNHKEYERNSFHEKQERIKKFQEELDLKLNQVYRKLERSKYQLQTQKQFESIKRRIKTETYPIDEEDFVNETDYHYVLPHNNYNSRVSKRYGRNI